MTISTRVRGLARTVREHGAPLPLLCLLALGVAACSTEGVSGPTGSQGSPMGLGFGDTTPTAATPTVAPTALPPVAVDGFGRFQSPTRMAIGRDGVLYVSDTEAGIVAKHARSGERLGALVGLQRPLGLALYEPEATVANVCELCLPNGGAPPSAACAASGRPVARGKVCRSRRTFGARAFVGDEADGSVRIFFRDRIVGALGRGAGEFQKPNAIAVTGDGVVYVVDSTAQRVKVYTADGASSGAIGAPGDVVALQFPTDIAVNEGAGELYVSDFGAQRIVVLDLTGAFKRNVTAPPNAGGDPIFFRPAGIGITPTGNLLVIDNALAVVAVITPSGALVDSIGYREGRYWTGDLELPIDAVSDGTRVYVSSNQAGRVGVFAVKQ